jgi:hypothetical protein
MVFDPGLYVSMLEQVRAALLCDRMQITLEDRKSVVEVHSAEALLEDLQKTPYPEPFPQMVMYRESRARVYVEATPWARVGGPDPYHDSYAVAFFADSTTMPTIRVAVKEALYAAGAGHTPMMTLDAVPTAPRLTGLRAWLYRWMHK